LGWATAKPNIINGFAGFRSSTQPTS
jgi:hypothetical protein